MGLTTVFLDQAMDTGEILFQEKEPIHPEDTAGSLHDRLMHKGAALVLKTVQAIEQGNCAPKAQVAAQESLNKKAPKIYKADCTIDWHQEQEVVLNFIRGLSPYPAAWADLNGKVYKILSASVAPLTSSNLAAGQVDTDGTGHVYVGTQSNPVAIRTLQPAGKKAMDVQEFLRGNKV